MPSGIINDETPVLEGNVAAHQAGMATLNNRMEDAKNERNRDWSNLPEKHPLNQFVKELPALLEKTGYTEMYGVELKITPEGKPPAHTTLMILQKFLRANEGDLTRAKEQLTNALKWRKEYKPLDALNETFPQDKFGGLGYVTKVTGATETKNEQDVVTFNIYGAAAKDPKKTFGDTDAFVRWRVALMELTLQQLDLNSGTEIIPDYGVGQNPYQFDYGKGADPYLAIQVHDYQSVSFFRQPSEIKQSSQKIIDMFQRYYPETVSYKYFVNVPTIMQWMMGAMKMLMSKDSIQKMTWMTAGNQLNQYLGSDVPKEYGGKGPALEGSAMTVKYDTQQAGATPVADDKTGGESAPAEAAAGHDLGDTQAPEIKT
ncbi:phosphatidylinositol transfer protein SFH5 [Hortaea werneckii]|nr:phosphatidylinositol transfer protein SFH5 [Hortaea werneckii]